MNKLSAKQIAEQVSPTDPLLRLAELLIRIEKRENVIEELKNDSKRNTNNPNKAV